MARLPYSCFKHQFTPLEERLTVCIPRVVTCYEAIVVEECSSMPIAIILKNLFTLKDNYSGIEYAKTAMYTEGLFI
jgi:hypothetical protein